MQLKSVNGPTSKNRIFVIIVTGQDETTLYASGRYELGQQRSGELHRNAIRALGNDMSDRTPVIVQISLR